MPPGGLVVPGDRVRLRALLMPPSPPVEPRGFDFARYAWFMQLGAVGYAWDPPELVAHAESRGWRLAIAAVRQSIAIEVSEAAPGAAGAVAVALLTGLRGALPEQIWDEWAIAGIIHLLSISGLHMALVAGTVFFAVRVALALAPPLALRLPTKKVAALLALIGAFGYLLISGASVPAVRSFIMTAIMLLAVMVDRNPFSMRLVTFAALVLLLLKPEDLVGASFQMSFAAVIALIAAYETGMAKRTGGSHGLDRRRLLYIAGCALTTVVASAATTPFSIYHFSRFSTYGIVANLIAVPLSAVWIMPLGMLGLLLIPLGLAAPCFVLMAQGIEIIIAVAAFVARLPGAALDVAQPPPAALLATVAGGLWLCLWRTPWRRLGLLGIALGLRPDAAGAAGGSAGRRARPDRRRAPRRRPARALALAARPLDHRQLAAERGPEGGSALAGGRRRPPGPALRRAGLHRRARRSAHRPGAAARGARGGLRAREPGDQLSAGRAVPERHAPDRPGGAPGDAGGLALWIGRDGIATLSVREVRGERPWARDR